jgi:hypothetical protein
MRLFRRNALPAPDSGQDLLEFLGATSHQLPHGFWVYALREADGTVLRAGQVGENSAGNLISRLRDHIYTYGDRFCYYSLLRPRDQWQADLWEGMLVDWYQPEANVAQTARVEELRRRIANAKGGAGLRGYRDLGEGTG